MRRLAHKTFSMKKISLYIERDMNEIIFKSMTDRLLEYHFIDKEILKY